MEVRRIHRKKPVELQGHQLAVAKQSNYPLVYRRKTPKSQKLLGGDEFEIYQPLVDLRVFTKGYLWWVLWLVLGCVLGFRRHCITSNSTQ
jgi:hypothetical protein